MRNLSLRQLAERARQRTWLVDLRDLVDSDDGLRGQLIYVHQDVMIGLNFLLRGTVMSLGAPAVFVEGAGVRGARGGAADAAQVERTVLGALDLEVVARDVRERVLGL